MVLQLDRDHLPWHGKNLFVHTFVEQGVLGTVAMLLILAGGLLHLARAPTRLQAHAPTLLAALVGLATVGMADSLLDMPRITVFLLLLAWLALTCASRRRADRHSRPLPIAMNVRTALAILLSAPAPAAAATIPRRARRTTSPASPTPRASPRMATPC